MSEITKDKIKIGNHRWTICALLFFATTINYLDRNILGILAPTLTKEIGWTPIEYGYITTVFQAAYALGLAFFGWFIDKYGTKIGYSLLLLAGVLRQWPMRLQLQCLGSELPVVF